MARYALRNQNKIKQNLGLEFHKWLVASLNEYFAKHETIEEHTYPDEPRFKIIHVDNVQPKTDSFYELYVIKKKFDVFHLAYKSCAG
jgi:hypothetical protein